MTYPVTPITPEAASNLPGSHLSGWHLSGWHLSGWQSPLCQGSVAPKGVSAADNAAVKHEPRTFRATRVRTTKWVPWNLEGARVPAASLQRMANASTHDIRGAVVFDDGVSGSRKWSPPV
jgi:hypothetical protein